MPSWSKLLNILDLHDAALCLRVVRILYHRHVQFLLILAEGDIGRAITRGDFKDVEKLALGGYLQDLTAEQLGDIDVTIAVDLHAVRSKPPGFVLVPREKVEQGKV